MLDFYKKNARPWSRGENNGGQGGIAPSPNMLPHQKPVPPILWDWKVRFLGQKFSTSYKLREVMQNKKSEHRQSQRCTYMGESFKIPTFTLFCLTLIERRASFTKLYV